VGELKRGKFVIPGEGAFASFSAASDTLTETQRNGWLDWELQLPGSKSWIPPPMSGKKMILEANDAHKPKYF
jgi:hypothetical protein